MDHDHLVIVWITDLDCLVVAENSLDHHIEITNVCFDWVTEDFQLRAVWEIAVANRFISSEDHAELKLFAIECSLVVKLDELVFLDCTSEWCEAAETDGVCDCCEEREVVDLAEDVEEESLDDAEENELVVLWNVRAVEEVVRLFDVLHRLRVVVLSLGGCLLRSWCLCH